MICGENQYIQMLYLLWDLSDFNQIINRSRIIGDETETLEHSFGKLLKFIQRYDFINPHHQFI